MTTQRCPTSVAILLTSVDLIRTIKGTTEEGEAVFVKMPTRCVNALLSSGYLTSYNNKAHGAPDV